MAVLSRETSSGDDDGALSVTAGLAKEAEVLFQSGKFGDCIKVLNQLLEKKKDDPKVLHNIAITESFRDGCSDPKRLLEVLTNVKASPGCPIGEMPETKRSEDLACAAGENVDAVGNLGNKTLIGTKGNNSMPMLHQFSEANSSQIAYTDEYDTSVTMFNMAVIWFHLHEYGKSFSILESLFQNIEPIDEATAFRICLLILDVALLSDHVLRSADVVNYVEKVFFINNLISQGDNGNSAQLQSSTLVPKPTSVPSSITVPDASGSDLSTSANASESPLSRTLSEENIETFLSTLDISGQNPPRPSGLPASNDLARTQVYESISTIDLRLKLHLYKVQFLLLTRNLKAAKREVKMAINMACGKDYTLALFLKSQLEYARGNHRKAIKLLMASNNQAEMGISSIYHNNLGCIYYRIGKYHTSSVFFSKAVSFSSSSRKEKPLKLSTFSQDKSLLIVYNCGMQYLACGKPILAARCFHKASLVFYNRPLLWLRLTECCLVALEKGLLKSSAAPSDRSEVKVHVIGKGKWRQLAMEDGICRNGQVNFDGRENLFLGDDRQPALSMSFARQCLHNALHLLNCSEAKYSNSGLPSNSAVEPMEEDESREAISLNNTNYKSASDSYAKPFNVTEGSGQVNANGEVKEQKGANSLNSSLQSSISDFDAICRKENQMIKQALLADLAYVELELGNPLKALSAARSLLRLSECYKIYIFLGNVYAAESLCLLNRPKEAAEHLLTYMSGANSVELPYIPEDCEQFQAEKTMDCEEWNDGSVAVNTSADESQDVFLKPEEARGTLYANLAAMSAMQGDLKQAHQFVMQAMSSIPDSPQAVLTAIYVDLMHGNTQEALAKLKQCNHIRFLPGNLTPNGSC
ncbi:unnamed protein product [Ilex paraguariensis]|uniref:CCR4-NOT transcription complex subunit 10 n=1 Tax=Ilex paraguariensis TaxID=185542 RepID=A0ABC8QVG3_9AQUA